MGGGKGGQGGGGSDGAQVGGGPGNKACFVKLGQSGHFSEPVILQMHVGGNNGR